MIRSLGFGRKLLLATSLLVVVSFSFFTLHNDARLEPALGRALESRVKDAGRLAANSVEHWLGGRLSSIELVAQSLLQQGVEEDARNVLTLQTVRDSFVYAYFGRADGSFQMATEDPAPDGYDPRTRPWYHAARDAGATVITEPYLDATQSQLMVTVAVPLIRQGQLQGVVGGDLGLDTLTTIISALDFDGMGYAFLVSADGKVLVHPNKDLVMKSLRDIYPQNTPAISTGFSEVEVDGTTRILTFAPVKGLPSVNWYIGVSVDKDKAYSMLSEFRASAIIATVIAVVIIMILLGMLIRVLMQPLHIMGRAMQDIAQGEGDLTRRLAIHTQDEFGELASAFNRFVERIHGSIREVSSATNQVNQVAKLVLNASNSSMSNSDEQANRTNSVAAAINELGAAAQEIARNAADASNQASSARTLAEDGRQVVERTISAMNELSGKIRASCGNIETLNSKTVNIGQILEVIKGISEQTNLLALNAAIEAARAGEAGRGFAVVADEVRNLAHRTQKSAQEIQQMIEELQVGAREAVTTMTESQRYSEQSVEIANQAGERLGSVTHRIGEIDGMNQSVATATEEQTAVVDSLNMDITEINTLNQEGVENLQATLRACADLDQQAARLQQLVGSFRI
ncbi:methyl-accepting chemotaxis protein PctA [Metapseudomonas resinovorans]|uniref:methyl-accepting chemotaxis protein n=1 Tax=Metapseudomonas resinovorans TaxID=53412 RepID=UPI000984950C|nr:methyl-accepting chemotaxis protein [Pseudomonas resinovorans]GLZ88307.1 methyl-accepting chemotaxis protein PctA [Pseudomonas resinovorans]